MATRNPQRRKLLVQTRQQPYEPEVPVIIKDDSDGARSVAGQRRGSAVRTVIQPFDSLLNRSPPRGETPGAPHSTKETRDFDTPAAEATS